MSISQIKKHFEDLSSYLGRDQTGLEKLRKLKESVNSVRTRLSEREICAENAERQTELARTESIRTKTELESARLEIHRLQQLYENANREVLRLTKTDTEPVEEESDVDGKLQQNQYRASIKRLRKTVRWCPQSKKFSISTISKGLCYNRTDFSNGWSHDAIWVLGAAVAVLSSVKGYVTIMSDENIYELDPPIEDSNGDLMRKHQTMNWLRNNIDRTEQDPTNHRYVE